MITLTMGDVIKDLELLKFTIDEAEIKELGLSYPRFPDLPVFLFSTKLGARNRQQLVNYVPPWTDIQFPSHRITPNKLLHNTDHRIACYQYCTFSSQISDFSWTGEKQDVQGKVSFYTGYNFSYSLQIRTVHNSSNKPVNSNPWQWWYSQ